MYDVISARLKRSPASNSDIAAELQSSFPHLALKDITAVAEKAIELLARSGDIEVRGSTLYARDSVRMSSPPGTKFTFRDNSQSVTDRSKIVAGEGAEIQGSGGAEIRQDQDGSISFLT